MAYPLIITFREGLEAALIVGVLLAYLNGTGNRRLASALWWGVGVGVLVSLVVAAAVFFTVGQLAKTGEELLEAGALALGAIAVTFVVLWMARQGSQMQRELRARAGQALTTGSTLALSLLAFTAVFREGVEVSLLLVSQAMDTRPTAVLAGAGVGAGLAVLLGIAVYRGSRRLDLRLFFNITSIALIVFAAGLVGKATLAFQAGGLLPGTITVADLSGVLPETGVVGGLLAQLVGYTSTPSVLQVIFYLSYLAVALNLYFGLRPREQGVPALLEAAPRARSWVEGLLRHPWVPTAPQVAMGALLVYLLAVALVPLDVGPFNNQGMLAWGPFVSGEMDNNLFEFAMWVVWLPLLTITAAVAGRLWCGNLCPLRLATDWARTAGERLLGRGSATGSTVRMGWLLPLAFILITFLVKSLPVQFVPRFGAYLFLGILGLGVVVGFLFRRGAWCRYLCPIGGWLARISRLSALTLRPAAAICTTCETRPCVSGSGPGGRCPTLLNPSRLETTRDCLACWACVKNCPQEKRSLGLAWRSPGTELARLAAPNVWESLFVAAMVGMYVAVGHRSPGLAGVPFPVLFFGLTALSLGAFLALCLLVSATGALPFRQAITNLGYIFLPLEFGTAVIAFGDDALEFLGIIQPVAAVFLAIGFVGSAALAVSIMRRAGKGAGRSLGAAVPVGAALLFVLFLWLQWYASGVVIDLT